MCVSVCLFLIEIQHGDFRNYSMTPSYAKFSEKGNAAIFVLIRDPRGGLWSPFLDPPKLAFCNTEWIPMKFGIEVTYQYANILKYMKFWLPSNKGVHLKNIG